MSNNFLKSSTFSHSTENLETKTNNYYCSMAKLYNTYIDWIMNIIDQTYDSYFRFYRNLPLEVDMI